MIDQLHDEHLFQPGFGNQAQSQAETDQVEGNSSEERTQIGSSTTQVADQRSRDQNNLAAVYMPTRLGIGYDLGRFQKPGRVTRGESLSQEAVGVGAYTETEGTDTCFALYKAKLFNLFKRDKT